MTVAEPNGSTPPEGPVVLEYADLLAGKDLVAEVGKAFGEGGLGLCVVRGVNGLQEARRRLLPLSRQLALLDSEVLAQYERPETQFCIGWSRGKEKFKGKADVAKGSFYANPIFDDPAAGDEEVRLKYPFAAHKNVWPKEIPDLEPAAKEMGRLMYEVAKPLVQQCDRLVKSRHPSYDNALFEAAFTRSRMVCGRLLHYYAAKEAEEDPDASWCGWHNDNSVITALVPAIWLDEETGEEVQPASSSGGLFIKSRSGEIVRVSIPSDCLAFQIGEAAQIIGGGVLVATPHQVRSPVAKAGDRPLCRETYALFIEPQWDAVIQPPAGVSYEEVLRGEETELIPPLSKRLKLPEGQRSVVFGKLLADSFQEYYQHNNAGA